MYDEDSFLNRIYHIFTYFYHVLSVGVLSSFKSGLLFIAAVEPLCRCKAMAPWADAFPVQVEVWGMFCRGFSSAHHDNVSEFQSNSSIDNCMLNCNHYHIFSIFINMCSTPNRFLASDCHFASGGGGGGGGGSGSKRTCSITCIYAAPLVPEDSGPGLVECVWDNYDWWGLMWPNIN